jgi:AraC-like DNA-binding protein/quercetin dioxygenase-like cupin family protein
MSPTRQLPGPVSSGSTEALAVGPFPLARGEGFERHQHENHQLAWTSSGVLTMSTPESTWVLPRSRALWMPAGVPHAVDVAVTARMYSLYFGDDGCPIRWTVPTVVSVSPLLAELILHLVDPTVRGAARARAETFVYDLLEPVAVAPLHTPTPTDERARAVTDALVANPADPRTLAEWGRAVGASERTLTRIFGRETGLSFTDWRTQIRLVAALPLLASGAAVAPVAREVGYANPSAFIAAFRRVFGVTPRAYFAVPADPSESR